MKEDQKLDERINVWRKKCLKIDTKMNSCAEPFLNFHFEDEDFFRRQYQSQQIKIFDKALFDDYDISKKVLMKTKLLPKDKEVIQNMIIDVDEVNTSGSVNDL